MKNMFYETIYTGLDAKANPNSESGKTKQIRLNPEHWLRYNQF
jgi:hypothetical protein